MKEILKGMDGQGALRRLREEAELVLRRFAPVARLPIESCTEAERAAEMYGISQDTAEVLARIAQIATCTLEELGNVLNCFLDSLAAATYNTAAVLEELSEAEKAWERAKAAARLHRAQRKRRRAIEGRFRAEIRRAESLRFPYRIFRPPRRARRKLKTKRMERSHENEKDCGPDVGRAPVPYLPDGMFRGE